MNKTTAMDVIQLTIMHILFAHPVLLSLLKLLFNEMLKYGVCPRAFGYSLIIPVLKNVKKSVDDPNNYWPINIIPILAKIFECCLNSLLDKYLSVHNNQFGFVKGGGCNKAIYAVRSCFEYFNDRGSDVYFACLDAVKAIDRVNHYFLLSSMIEKGLPVKLVDIFKAWFLNLKASVLWNNAFSESFDVKSGVLQGSLLGPKFYNLITDKLLIILENTKLGCYIGNAFVGAVAYADDIILMSASCTKLQTMLKLCEDFGLSCDLKFNVTKSCVGCVSKSKRKVCKEFLLQNRLLPWTDKFKYLGVTFVTNNGFQIDCSERVQKFIASVSSVLRLKTSGIEHMFVDLLIKKCLPILFYGLDCCTLSRTSLNSVSKAWNMSFKWLFNMRKYDSTRLLFLSNNTMSMKFLLDMKIMQFYRLLSNSKNTLIVNIMLVNYAKIYDMFNMYGLSTCTNSQDINIAVYRHFLDYCYL